MAREIDGLIRLDAWLQRGEGGSVPIELLRKRGISVPPMSSLDDAELHRKLWQIVLALSELGFYLVHTDHLTDRELYQYLVREVLPIETFLDLYDPWARTTHDVLGGCSDDENRIFLTYYADETERAWWRLCLGEEVPPRQQAPIERDSFLPKGPRALDGQRA